jgi:hypothetical protein
MFPSSRFDCIQTPINPNKSIHKDMSTYMRIVFGMLKSFRRFHELYVVPSASYQTLKMETARFTETLEYPSIRDAA